jgi:hypothetical protein
MPHQIDTDTHRDDTKTDAGSHIPPIEALFVAQRPDSWCAAHEVLITRNAAQLWVAATSLAGVLDAQMADTGASVLPYQGEWERMPWVVQNTYSDWYGQFVDSVLTLADDLAAGRCPIPRSTAEEMALQLVIEDVTDPADSNARELLAAAARRLPVNEWDEEWDDVAASLFPYPKVRRLVADRFGRHIADYELVAEPGLARAGPACRAPVVRVFRRRHPGPPSAGLRLQEPAMTAITAVTSSSTDDGDWWRTSAQPNRTRRWRPIAHRDSCASARH